MPIYPALALLIGSAIAAGGRWVQWGTRSLVAVCSVLFVVLAALLAMSWRMPAVGDISRALTQNPDMYTLSMGHMSDLTLGAFAYLKLPLAMAVIAFGIGAVCLLMWRRERVKVALATSAMMIVFFQASRVALVRFDPYLGSYALAEALKKSPPGQLIEANAYYAFSSVFFYTNKTALLWNGRINNLEYGSYAPGAPQVFIGDEQFARLWNGPERFYLVTYPSELPKVEQLAGREKMIVVRQNGDNFLLTNQPLP